MKKEKKDINWHETTMEIDVDEIVKSIYGENYSGFFDFIGKKIVYIKGKGYFQKDLVNERLKEF
jgi:hypothetical protein